MRQRVGFARALVAQPEVLCMDEPFSALDVLTAENLRTQVVDLCAVRGTPALEHLPGDPQHRRSGVHCHPYCHYLVAPGRVRSVIVNPLPYPRDVNSRQFAALVDQVHAAITALVLPDEPAQSVAARPAGAGIGRTGAAAEGAPGTIASTAGPRVEAIPNAPVETIVGLLEILEDSQETINVFDLSAKIGREFGETIAIVKAAEMLGLVDTPKDDVAMTQVGLVFSCCASGRAQDAVPASDHEIASVSVAYLTIGGGAGRTH